ncbi:MAG: hypothetical protein IKT08_07540 [Bacteroidales bacterium]|nr:hypothetical protein [Bacteroidales bacterium]
MTVNATLNCNEPFIDDAFHAQIKEAFSADNRKPGQSVLNFILGYAASYESIKSDMLGCLDLMKN